MYEVSPQTIQNETGLSQDVIKKSLKKFSKANKIHYKNGWICLVNFIKYQNYGSPLIRKGIEQELIRLPYRIYTVYKPHIDGMQALLHLNLNLNLNFNSSPKPPNQKSGGEVGITTPPPASWEGREGSDASAQVRDTFDPDSGVPQFVKGPAYEQYQKKIKRVADQMHP